MGPAQDEHSEDYLLVFVTTSCQVCEPVWEMLAALGSHRLMAAGRVVVVTPSRSMEDERRANELLPPGAWLHMSSDTWFMYGITQAGTFLLVRPDKGAPLPWLEPGAVLGSCAPSTLDGLLQMIGPR